jgi:hypothetical protein
MIIPEALPLRMFPRCQRRIAVPVKRFFLGVLAAALLPGLAAGSAHAADIFTLKSSTFEDGKIMPKKVANSKANTQNNPDARRGHRETRAEQRGARARQG